MQVSFPWPNPKLFPNAKKKHFWAVISPIVKQAREDACDATLAALPIMTRKAIKDSEGYIRLKVTFTPPDKRRRDDDGCIGAM